MMLCPGVDPSSISPPSSPRFAGPKDAEDGVWALQSLRSFKPLLTMVHGRFFIQQANKSSRTDRSKSRARFRGSRRCLAPGMVRFSVEPLLFLLLFMYCGLCYQPREVLRHSHKQNTDRTPLEKYLAHPLLLCFRFVAQRAVMFRQYSSEVAELLKERFPEESVSEVRSTQLYLASYPCVYTHYLSLPGGFTTVRHFVTRRPPLHVQ